jgi:outer membrane protein
MTKKPNLQGPLLVAAVLALAFLPGITRAEDSGTKSATLPIAVIDMQGIMESSEAGKSIIAQLKDRRESLQKEAADLEKKLRETEQELIQGRKDMNPEEFEKKKKEFETQFSKDRQTILKQSGDLENARKAALRDLREKIAKVSADLADERKFMMVADREFVVIVDKSLDVTGEVLKRLNDTVKKIPLSDSGKKD